MRKILFFTVTLPITLGILSGTYLAKKDDFNSVIYKQVAGKSLVLAAGQEIGLNFKDAIRDNAIGLLVKSDDTIKGTHKLIRGADAFTIYLTSSVIDLNQFLNRGIQVWGETYQRKGIGWFMDITKIKVIK